MRHLVFAHRRFECVGCDVEAGGRHQTPLVHRILVGMAQRHELDALLRRVPEIDRPPSAPSRRHRPAARAASARIAQLAAPGGRRVDPPMQAPTDAPSAAEQPHDGVAGLLEAQTALHRGAMAASSTTMAQPR
jgi:hypothetical protein